MSNTIDPRKIDSEVYYTLEQVSEFLNLSYSSVLKIKKSGSFKDIKKIGRRYLISGKAILHYLEKESAQ